MRGIKRYQGRYCETGTYIHTPSTGHPANEKARQPNVSTSTRPGTIPAVLHIPTHMLHSTPAALILMEKQTPPSIPRIVMNGQLSQPNPRCKGGGGQQKSHRVCIMAQRQQNLPNARRRIIPVGDNGDENAELTYKDTYLGPPPLCASTQQVSHNKYRYQQQQKNQATQSPLPSWGRMEGRHHGTCKSGHPKSPQRTV